MMKIWFTSVIGTILVLHFSFATTPLGNMRVDSQQHLANNGKTFTANLNRPSYLRKPNFIPFYSGSAVSLEAMKTLRAQANRETTHKMKIPLTTPQASDKGRPKVNAIPSSKNPQINVENQRKTVQNNRLESSSPQLTSTPVVQSEVSQNVDFTMDSQNIYKQSTINEMSQQLREMSKTTPELVGKVEGSQFATTQEANFQAETSGQEINKSTVNEAMTNQTKSVVSSTTKPTDIHSSNESVNVNTTNQNIKDSDMKDIEENFPSVINAITESVKDKIKQVSEIMQSAFTKKTPKSSESRITLNITQPPDYYINKISTLNTTDKLTGSTISIKEIEKIDEYINRKGTDIIPKASELLTRINDVTDSKIPTNVEQLKKFTVTDSTEMLDTSHEQNFTHKLSVPVTSQSTYPSTDKLYTTTKDEMKKDKVTGSNENLHKTNTGIQREKQITNSVHIKQRRRRINPFGRTAVFTTKSRPSQSEINTGNRNKDRKRPIHRNHVNKNISTKISAQASTQQNRFEAALPVSAAATDEFTPPLPNQEEEADRDITAKIEAYKREPAVKKIKKIPSIPRNPKVDIKPIMIQGPPGPRGERGPKGEKGEKGERGEPGAPGTSGSGAQVAMSAVLTKHFGPAKDVIIPFDLTLIDLGDNYDPETGVFISTVPGTYVISAYLMSHPGSKLNGRIYINNSPVAALWADDSKNAGFYPSSSIQTISHLDFGDQVYVMLVDGGYGESWIHANYNAFNIYLLYEDVFV